MFKELRTHALRLTAAMLAITAALAGGTALGASTKLRWTNQEDRNPRLNHVLAKINAQTGYGLTAADFQRTEDRDLAFTHYARYEQMQSGVHVSGMSIRIWTNRARFPRLARLVQMEAQVSERAQVAPELATKLKDRESVLGAVASSDADATAQARAAVQRSNDPFIVSTTRAPAWRDGRLLAVYRIKSKHGVHFLEVDASTLKVLTNTYTPFPSVDDRGGKVVPSGNEMQALIYPIYEEYNGQVLPRKQVTLKYLLPNIPMPAVDGDPFAALRNRQYLNSKEDSVLGSSAAGRADGYWSTAWLRALASQILANSPQADNSVTSGHVLLQGRYATINIFPDAMALPAVTIPKQFGNQLMLQWKALADGSDWEAVPAATYYGKPLAGEGDALNRDASIDPNNDAAVYINSGFDEVQVYYSINQLFESLRPMGFSDPELSETAFHAFLFNTNIEDADNAYYDDGTINFSTYPAGHLNLARDNTTIWHELGHGVMDRLMGTQLHLADTGGLSEGMADFVAEMVIRETNGDAPFPGHDDQRIINSTGFYMTNEVHDDGEAYGGTMKAILDGAVNKYGRRGLHMVVDLVLEAMRLSRDNPGLTADDWFDHLRFADQLGRRGVRRPGQLKEFIDASLGARNFAADGERAEFRLQYQGKDINAGDAGSRGHEIRLDLHASEQKTYSVDIGLKDGNSAKFKYPVSVKVFFNSGPLQGAIDWVDEDHEPALFTIAQAGDALTVPLTVNGTCDQINREDGTCSDFAYVQIYNDGDTRPVAKKRFYLRIKTAE